MNTQGWMRGLMAKNMKGEKFIEHVADCLGREFEMASSVLRKKEGYTVKLDDYAAFVPIEEVAALQAKDPYSLDKFILDKLMMGGFEFDKYRSQYIRYCYCLFYRASDGCVY